MEIKDYSVFMQLRNHGYIYNVLEGGYIASNDTYTIHKSLYDGVNLIEYINLNIIGSAEKIINDFELNGYVKSNSGLICKLTDTSYYKVTIEPYVGH